MSRYRKVLSKIWNDEKFTGLSEDGQRLFLYHLTSDRATPFLLYIEGPGAISDALRMPSRRLSEAMKELSAKGMVWYADDGSNLVFLPKALRHPENAPESPNSVKTWRNLLADLPKTPFYYKCLSHWVSLSEGITHALTLAFLKASPLANPIQEQEQEQEKTLLVGDESTDECPHQEIIKIFHTELPMLTHIRDWTPARQSLLKARWRSKTEYQDLEWWKEFFGYIKTKCPFLLGLSENGNGKRKWQADLPWILEQRNFTKIVEGGFEG